MQLTPLQITRQLYTSAACQHLPGALTRSARNEKLSLLASTQQVRGPLGQLLGNATDLVVGRVEQTPRSVLKDDGLLLPECCWWKKKMLSSALPGRYDKVPLPFSV